MVIILRNSRGATSSENREVTLLLEKFTFIKKISPFLRVSRSLHQEEGDDSVEQV